MSATEKADEAIQYSENAGIGVITLCRPAQLNTFRQRDYLTMIGLLEQVSASTTLRALVVTAKGRAFSAGQDLSELDPHNLPTPERQAELLGRIQEITRTLIGSDVPTIAAFNGFAVGVGLEIAVACDFRIATPEAYFMFAEARRGLFPTNGVLWLLPRLIGVTKAKEMLLSAGKFDAQYGLNCGFLTEIAPRDQLHQRAMAMAESLAANSRETIRGIKALLRRTYDVSLEEMMDEEVRLNLEVMNTKDFAEGVSSFFEKRPATFDRNT